MSVAIRITNVNVNKAALLREFALQTERILVRAVPGIFRSVGTIIEASLLESPEYQALLPGGELYGALGVLNAAEAVRQIIEELRSNVNLFAKGNILTVEITKGDFSNLLDLPAASFTSEKGQHIPWLEWLLFSGAQVITTGYSFIPGAFRTSRTGEGLMVRANTSGTRFFRQGKSFSLRVENPGPFRIPEKFSGTATDNWITRSVTAKEPIIVNLIQTEIIRAANAN